MANYQDVEHVIEQIKTLLLSDLAGYLEFVNNHKSVSMDVENITTIYTTMMSDSAIYPCIELIADPTVYADHNYKSSEQTDSIYCLITITNSEAFNTESVEETLFRKLCRTMRGVQNTLKANPTLDHNVVNMFVETLDYSPVELREDGRYIQSGLLKITVLRYTED